MTIEHSTITDPDIHEPKGVAAATVNKVYVSDGAGSGSWQKVAAGQLDATGQNQGKLLLADGSNGASWDTLVWKDLLGFPVSRNTGATAPSYTAFRGGAVDQYAFSVNDEIGFQFHIPHDWAVGTDMHFHVHWSHNGTAISGNMVWTYAATYAKGHNQAIFPAEVTGTITYATTNIATTPQYIHRIDEIQLTAASPSVSQIDTDNIEVDGVILINLTATTIPTITGGTPNEPFILYADLHYQANPFGTKNKVPNFYT